ncbi:MAG TPA: hypothetical protein VMN36_02975, partial [Verrucomicrobiales bacterium]|nr:hypothetical protein [Verrucomicrobiales bacterium]
MARRSEAVHVATNKKIYKGKIYYTHLLRRTFRKDGRVLHQTLGNISHLPEDLIELIRLRLRGESGPAAGPWRIVRSLPHGHVAAVFGQLQGLGLESIIASRPSRQRDLVVAMIVLRILFPASKLACARALREQSATSSLALELGLDAVEDDELYEAMDWLLPRQGRIEKKLAAAHLQEASLVLYDVSGSYCTGRRSTLVQYGHNR